MVLSGIIGQDGLFDGALAEKTTRIEAVGRSFAYVLNEGEPRLLIYQTDVRAIQLAKAALYAGAKLLIEKRGAGPPQRVTLVGAFGSHIDTVYAMALGLIPDCDLDPCRRRRQFGGHRRPHRPPQSRRARRRSRASCGGSTKIETAIEPNFQAEFVAAMALPHASDAFDNLAKAIKLPERKAAPSGRSGRSRRR